MKNHGFLPTHFAGQSRIDRLVEQNTFGLLQTTRHGDIPLQLFCETSLRSDQDYEAAVHLSWAQSQSTAMTANSNTVTNWTCQI